MGMGMGMGMGVGVGMGMGVGKPCLWLREAAHACPLPHTIL